MTPSEGITEILVAANVGDIAPANDWPIYEAQFPDEVDQCILVREPGGRTSEVRIAIDYPSIQVLVRAVKQGYIAARQKTEDIFLALQAIPSGPTQWPELTSCLRVGGMTFVGYDELERPIWSQNFQLIVSKDPEGYRDL